MNPRFQALLDHQGYEDYEVDNLLIAIYETRLEDQSYNIQKQLDNVFQKIEYREKDALADSMIESEKRLILYDLKPNLEHDLRKLIMKQQWADLIPFTDRIITQLENKYLTSDILDLIAATNIDFEKMKDYPLTLYDVVVTLRALLVEVRIDYELRLYLQALQKARRCKEILEYAVYVMDIVKKEGLPIVTKSQVQKIDEVNGKPIHKIK